MHAPATDPKTQKQAPVARLQLDPCPGVPPGQEQASDRVQQAEVTSTERGRQGCCEGILLHWQDVSGARASDNEAAPTGNASNSRDAVAQDMAGTVGSMCPV